MGNLIDIFQNEQTSFESPQERMSIEIQLVVRNGTPCMTLSQIAELFNKEKHDVRKSLESLDAELLQDVEFIRDSRGYVTEAYIPERPALMLVTGFAPLLSCGGIRQ